MIEIIDLSNVDYELLDVVKIDEHIDYTMDIEVEDTHYYLLDNGIITHNTTSMMTQTSSGIEPVFSLNYIRRRKLESIEGADFVDQNGDGFKEYTVYHSKVYDWMKITGDDNVENSPWWGYCAEDINWENRVKMQAAIQKNIDHSISSTINLPEDISVDEVKKIYETAWKSGCKGVTVYRKGSRSGVLIENKKDKPRE